MAKKKAAPKKSKKQKPAPKKAKAKAKPSAVKAKASAPAKAKAVAKGKIAAKATSQVAAKTTSKVVAKAKGKVAAKATPAKAIVAKARTAPRRGASDPDTDLRVNQEVEIVSTKPRSRVARAGAGSGDLQGISTVEDVDSESEDELLEEGQSFEAGIVGGVERAGDDEEHEVVTHEVLEDDVPREYDDEDRP
jgi:hypothetical protein